MSNEQFDKDFRDFERLSRMFELDAVSFIPIEQFRKILFYYEELKHLADVPGDIVELGLWRASTLCFLSDMSIILDGPNCSRTSIGFDTFSGFPEGTEFKRERDKECQDYFRDTSRDVVLRKIESRPNRRIKILEGDISVTLSTHFGGWANRIAMAICDADTGDTTYAILNQIWKRMAPGGRIYFDEYSRDGWSETDGVDRFFGENGLPLSLIKRAPGIPIAFVQIDEQIPLCQP